MVYQPISKRLLNINLDDSTIPNNDKFSFSEYHLTSVSHVTGCPAAVVVGELFGSAFNCGAFGA